MEKFGVRMPRGAFGERRNIGGRVVVRPDGYIGAVTGLDDQPAVADYFAQISR